MPTCLPSFILIHQTVLRPRVLCFHLPSAVYNIEQLDFKLLGVLLQSNFKMDMHVLSILSPCTQRMYLLKLLKQQGMSQQQLSVIAHSIIVSRILYALPAWGDFLSVELKKQLAATLRWFTAGGAIGIALRQLLQNGK